MTIRFVCGRGPNEAQFPATTFTSLLLGDCDVIAHLIRLDFI